MGLIDFHIMFEKPLPTYFPGENVNGHLVVNLSSGMKMVRIKVCFLGKGAVQWTEVGRGRENATEITYSDHEPYFNSEINVYNGPNLPTGVRNFPFNFTLPYNIPSSFERKDGHVRYWVDGFIVNPGRDRKLDHRCHRLVTVNGLMDLNLSPWSPKCRQPGENSKHKTLWCFCPSGPISAVIHTNRTGFVPGEMIVFNAEIDNQSNRQINGSKLRLVEHVHYVTQRKTKSETKVVVEIDPGTSDMWEGVVMRIPAVLQTNLAGNCRIIKIKYELEFHVIPSGMSSALVVKLPITIGTIPLQE